jgi:hypothetical protein
MTQPALLIFATCYDAVTRRTYQIAQHLLSIAEQSGVATSTLFEILATSDDFLKEIARCRPEVIAFYSHGGESGVIMAQNHQPCWTAQTVPDLSGIVLFAHACRTMSWFRDQAINLKSRLLIGYEKDLISPPNGSSRFWEIYEELHSFVPHRIASKIDDVQVRIQFYELCTNRLHELKDRGSLRGSLIELVAITQSRDQIVFHKNHHP